MGIWELVSIVLTLAVIIAIIYIVVQIIRKFTH